jgi:hypothetical protein
VEKSGLVQNLHERTSTKYQALQDLRIEVSSLRRDVQFNGCSLGLTRLLTPGIPAVRAKR